LKEPQTHLHVIEGGRIKETEHAPLAREPEMRAFREETLGDLNAGTSLKAMNLLEQDQSPEFPPGQAFERHFSPALIAKQWDLSVDLIRRIFENEPGVIRAGHDETLHRRRYITLRIPESVMRRVHPRLTQTRGKPI
jgi:hypothetical protein